MTEINIVKTYEVPDEDIETLIDMAGYGIGYWASAAEVDDELKTYVVTEDEDGSVHVLTYEALARTLVEIGMGEHRVGYPREYAKKYLLEMDAGEIDSDLADVVVQIAAFGEITYG